MRLKLIIAIYSVNISVLFLVLIMINYCLPHHTTDGSYWCKCFKLPVAIEYAAHAIVDNYTAADAPITAKC